jgi:hypothetical protein
MTGKQTMKELNKIKASKFTKFDLNIRFIYLNFFRYRNRFKAALRSIELGMTIRGAAREFNINRTTLSNHRNNPALSFNRGSTTDLLPEEEIALKEWIVGCLARGYCVRSPDVIPRATAMLRKRLGPNAKLLTLGWLGRFVKRHSIVLRTPENLTYPSACITEPNLRNWHGTVYTDLETDSLEHLLEDPKRILNGDESMVKLSPTTDSRKVLAPKGSRYIHQITNNDKGGLTVMGTFRADGKQMNPFIIYYDYTDYEYLDESVLNDEPLQENISVEDDPDASILTLPPTPRRKNKRITKRTSNIISSVKNIESLELTQIEKRQKICDKLQRAEDREEKRKIKLASDIEKAKKAEERVRLRLEKLQAKK